MTGNIVVHRDESYRIGQAKDNGETEITFVPLPLDETQRPAEVFLNWDDGSDRSFELFE